ncbi:MAG: 3-keto-disaccharide hydrolase [Pirellulales bacterium]
MNCLFAMALLSMTAPAAAEANPFVGAWALTIPGGGAGWLGVVQTDDGLKASILWGGGSVLPVTTAKVEGDTLIVTRVSGSKKRGAAVQETETIKAKLSGDQMNLTTERTRGEGKVFGQASFAGKRIPALPPKPDLAKVRFGEPVKLLNGKNLDGWKIIEKGAANGWTVKDGVLTNDPKQEPGKPHKNYGNLRTEREFEDFNLTLETNVPPGGNSGIYLRGIYEIQVADTYGSKLDSHNMGGIYSRICPTESAEKPAGQWQTYDITLVDRHVTIILNGKKIIDNQPLEGCTGGALWSDQFRPGPLYLQGDHTGANYRNIVLKPVVK